jgi:hypothetical protein
MARKRFLTLANLDKYLRKKKLTRDSRPYTGIYNSKNKRVAGYYEITAKNGHRYYEYKSE